MIAKKKWYLGLCALVMSVTSLVAQTPTLTIETEKDEPYSIKLVGGSSAAPVEVQTGEWKKSYDIGSSAVTVALPAASHKVEIRGMVTSLTCSDVGVQTVKASDKHPLAKLIANKHQMKSFSSGIFPQLTALSLSDGALEELLIPENSLLSNINLNNNTLRSLDLSRCPKLTRLQIAGNGLDACTLNDIYSTLPRLTSVSSSANLINGKLTDARPNEATTSQTTLATEKNWKVQIEGNGEGCIRNTLFLETDIRSEITFYLRMAQSGSVTFEIDWGDGLRKSYRMEQEANGRVLEVKGTPLGSRLAIYGEVARFEANNAEIRNIETRYLPELQYLGLRHNKIETLDLSKNPKLRDLYLNDNLLRELSLEANSLLETLQIRDNLFKQFDFAQVPHLKELAITRNPLASIDLSPLAELEKLYASSLKLQSICLEHHPKLYQVELAQNQLTALDISQNPAIGYINIEDNNLSAEALNALYLQLPEPERKVDWKNLLIGGEKSGAAKSLTRMAVATGWNPNVEGDGSGAEVDRDLLFAKLTKGWGESITLQVPRNAVVRGAKKVEELENGYARYQIYAPYLMIAQEMGYADLTGNGIGEVELVRAETLLSLHVGNNLLTSLLLQKAKHLNELSVYANQINTPQAVDDLIESLPQGSKENPSRLIMVDTKNINDKQPCTQEQVARAKEKNWEVYDFAGGAQEGKGVPFAGRDVHLENPLSARVQVAADARIGEIRIEGAEPTIRIDVYSAQGLAIQSGRTDAEGNYHVGDLTPGIYYIALQGVTYKVIL